MANHRRTTIKDLARALNVSVSTVSRALSDHPDISPRTKARVRELAEQLHYTTNLQASSFRSRRSGMIALVLPELNMFFSTSLIEGINHTLKASRKTLTVFLTSDSFSIEQEVIQKCLSWSVDAVLIAVTSNTANLDHLSPLVNNGIPVLFVDKSVDDPRFGSVVFDGRRSAQLAVEHLIASGHQKMLGLFASKNMRITRERAKGFIDAHLLAQKPMTSDQLLYIDAVDELPSVLETALALHPETTALFTMSDELSAHALRHLRSIKRPVPAEISIIGISDGPFAELTFPKLTHVRSSGRQLGMLAGNWVLRVSEGDLDIAAERLVIAPEVQVLESVRTLS